MPVKTWMVEKVCSGVSDVRNEPVACGSAKSGGAFTRRSQPGEDAQAKTLNIKDEPHNLPTEPESKAEVLQRAPCTGGAAEAHADTEPEPSGVAGCSHGAERKTEEEECGTCAEEPEMTSEVHRGTDEFRASTKSQADVKLSEADAIVLPPKLEQSCGPADRAEHLVGSDQHQEAELAIPGQNLCSKHHENHWELSQ